MESDPGTNSTVHRPFLEDPFRSWLTDSSSSSARRYFSWWLRSLTALALWKKSIPVLNLSELSVLKNLFDLL